MFYLLTGISFTDEYIFFFVLIVVCAESDTQTNIYYENVCTSGNLAHNFCGYVFVP